MIRRFRHIFTCVLLSLAVCGVKARDVVDLNKGWYLFNPYRPWTERMASPGDEAATSSVKVDLPHDFSISGPFAKENPSGQSGGYLPGGKALYRKNDVGIKEEWADKRIVLEFEGVYRNSEIYFNGIRIGGRPNGWVSFWYDVTRWVDFGADNMVAVKVDNTLQPSERWYSGSGITRPVRMIVTDKLHIEQWGVFVTTPEVESGRASVVVSTSVANHHSRPRTFELVQRVEDPGGRVVASAREGFSLSGGESMDCPQRMTVRDPKLWDTDSPNLYTLRTTIYCDGQAVDQTLTTFGIRTIRFDADKGFFLNGRSVKLKGVCLHHDGGMVGAAVPPGVWERRLGILKDMGCNAVRTAHNPFDPAFYDLCDRMGVLVMDEFLDEWSVHKLDYTPYGSNLFWDEWHTKDLTDLVMRDRNHPSVFMYSIGNEIMEQAWPEGAEMARELVDLLHRLDPTRPVTCGNNKQIEANKTGFTDEFDVVGYNYGPQFGNYVRDRERYPDRKFIGTESTRGMSTRGYYAFPVPADGKIVRNEDEYFSSYDGLLRKYGQEHEWQVTESLDYVAGMFLWTGIDYLGETSYPWPTKYSAYGALDACCFPKDAFWFYRSVWNDAEETLHLLPHWNWAGREGEPTPVWCYTSCEEVELFLNGRSQGRRRMGADGKLHIEWAEVKYRPGELRAIGYRGGRKVMETTVETTSEPVAVKIAADRRTISADGYDVVHFTVSTVDEKGRHVPTAQNALDYTLEGGKLLGIDNGDPQYVGSFTRTRDRRLFNGLALVIVQADDKSGKIELKVRGQGLKPASESVEMRDRPYKITNPNLNF